MNSEELIKTIDVWVNALEPKSTGIRIENSKDVKMKNVKISGMKKGIDVKGSSNIDMEEIEISSNDSKKLVELLKEFKTVLQSSPKNKYLLDNIFKKIEMVCSIIKGATPIMTNISQYLSSLG